jgi:SSS family solute:Na+ symporter
MVLKVGSKGWADGTSIEAIFPKLPWMDQMGLTALLTLGVIVLVSIKQNKGAEDSKAINLPKEIFNTSPLFNIGAFTTLIILTVIYALFW